MIPLCAPDLRSERELLMAKHQTFRPATLFEFKDIPSHALMAERLSVKSMADLKRFRRKDGSLPRLLIVPARLAVRATAEIRDVTTTAAAPLLTRRLRRPAFDMPLHLY